MIKSFYYFWIWKSVWVFINCYLRFYS